MADERFPLSGKPRRKQSIERHRRLRICWVVGALFALMAGIIAILFIAGYISRGYAAAELRQRQYQEYNATLKAWCDKRGIVTPL